MPRSRSGVNISEEGEYSACRIGANVEQEWCPSRRCALAESRRSRPFIHRPPPGAHLAESNVYPPPLGIIIETVLIACPLIVYPLIFFRAKHSFDNATVSGPHPVGLSPPNYFTIPRQRLSPSERHSSAACAPSTVPTSDMFLSGLPAAAKPAGRRRASSFFSAKGTVPEWSRSSH